MILPAILLTYLFIGGEKVVINEFSYDDSGTDDREFVEIYNPTSKPINIGGWRLDSNDQVGANKGYIVPANTMLAAGGFYVFGSSKVPNVNQIVGTTNIWENSQESLILKDKDGNVVDSLVYEANKQPHWAGIQNEGEGIWGNFTSIDNIETSWSRIRDGYDTNNNRNFRVQPSTPGKSNNQPVGPFLNNFDGLTTLTPVPSFGGSWKLPRVIDPTVVDMTGYNPNKIPASPQGKNAMICWDETGGGNHNMLLKDSTCDVLIEAYVYFDAKLEATGEREVWSIGAQGTSGTFMNLPDPSGAAGYLANGHTGVAWTFEVTDKAATLYLVDHNDGGRGTNAKTDRKVLGQFTLKAGTDDGWQRLRLELKGSTVTGYFGGTYGSTTTGKKITGTNSAPARGGVWISYREALKVNNGGRPFTCDHLTILPSASKAVVAPSFGVAKKTTTGTPRIGTNGCPLVGNASFQLTGVDLVPSGTSIWALGLRSGAFDMSKIGGQSGSFLYIVSILELHVTANAQGDVSLPAPIPNNPALKGASVSLQIFDIDPALGVFLKLGNSRAMDLKVD